MPECFPTTLDHITGLAKVLGGAVLSSALLDNVSSCRSGLAPHQGVDVKYIEILVINEYYAGTTLLNIIRIQLIFTHEKIFS